MAHFDARSMIDAATTGPAPARTVPHRLAEAAEMAAADPVVPALSPIVLAGAVRIADKVARRGKKMGVTMSHRFDQDKTTLRHELRYRSGSRVL